MGARHAVWGSDLGQVFNPPAEDGLAIMADHFLEAGFSEEEIRAGVGALDPLPRATKDVVGDLDVPVEVGGQAIRPGDLAVLDADGATVVAAERAEVVLAASAGRTPKPRSCSVSPPT